MKTHWSLALAAVLSLGVFACSGADDSEPANDPIGNTGADEESDGTQEAKTRHDTMATPQLQTQKTRHD